MVAVLRGRVGMRIEVRTGPVEDWRALHLLLVTCYAYMEGRVDPPSSLANATPEKLREKAKKETLVTIWADGSLAACGFLRDTGRSIYLGKLAVHPAHRGQGLLRRIIDEAEALARRTGRPVLELGTRVELVENHATFTALGFRVTAETAHPGFDEPTSLTMERRVTRA